MRNQAVLEKIYAVAAHERETWNEVYTLDLEGEVGHWRGSH